LAVPVFNIKPVNAVAFNQKADDLMIVLAKPYLNQASPVTQEKGPAKQIRRFNRVHHLCLHLLPARRSFSEGGSLDLPRRRFIEGGLIFNGR